MKSRSIKIKLNLLNINYGKKDNVNVLKNKMRNYINGIKKEFESEKDENDSIIVMITWNIFHLSIL